MTKERPILFSGQMVRAIMAGRKTQTRRIVKPKPNWIAADGSLVWRGGKALIRAGYGADYIHANESAVRKAMLAICPYGKPGEHLWVKETFAFHLCAGGEVECLHHRADGESCPRDGEFIRRWRPSIFMPRSYSRLTLEITRTGVERLHEISPADAIREGAEDVPYYAGLWNEINGDGAWEADPYVYVIEFLVI